MSNSRQISSEKTRERIDNFARKFGKPHLDLACHAAFPLALSPDLLYQIWANFVPYAPWTAVADTLLSPLFREVGFELYQGETLVRQLLLSALENNEKYGKDRILSLARFLASYTRQERTSPDMDLRKLAEGQNLVAMAYLTPNLAAKTITSLLSNVNHEDPEFIRILGVVGTLEVPLAQYMPAINDLVYRESKLSENLPGSQLPFVGRGMEIPLAAATEAIFSIIIGDLMQNPIFEKLRDKLKGSSPEKLAFQKALISAFYVFSRKYPDLSNSLFDEHFIQKPEVIKELSKILTPNLNPKIEILGKIWQSQFSLVTIENISVPLSYFVSTLQNEVKKQPQLRPFIDSRALDQLYNISNQSDMQTNRQTEIRDITNEIKLLIQQSQQKNLQAASYLMEQLHSRSVETTNALVNSEPSLSKLPENFPEMQIPLVGRNKEISQIINTLSDPNCRLISLVGPGGIGKTSLAIEVAKTVRDNFRNGISFVALALVTSSEFILSSLAAAAQIAIVPSKDIFPQIIDFFKDKEALLILDNLEHLIPDGEKVITTILENTSNDVKIIVTSRERLNITSEWVIDVEGLDFPSSTNTNYSTNSLLQYDAIQLFTNFARKVDFNFKISEENAADIVKICQLVEGSPLAIELAANWIKVLDSKGIVQEIERNMDFLRSDARFTSASHQNLRAVFEQSWDLLSEAEKTTYAKLSIFRGGFDLDAAAYVADASLDFLSSLIDKSLVKMRSGRYQILEVLDQYSVEKLLSDQSSYEIAKNKHCDYYLNLLADSSVDLKAGQPNDAVQKLGKEIGNIVDAWIWAINQQNYPLINSTTESLFLYYQYSGAIEDAENLVNKAKMSLINGSADTDLVLGRLLRFQARLSQILSRYDLALKYYRESLHVLKGIDPGLRNQKEISLVLDGLGAVSYTLGQYAEAKDYYLESANISEALDDKELMASTYMRLGDIASVFGNYPDAKEWLEKCLRLLEKLEYPRRLALALSNLADIECKLGSYDEAEYLLKRSLDTFLLLQDDYGQGFAEVNLGKVFFIKGNFEAAEKYCRSGLENFVEIHHEWGLAFALNHLAKGLIKMGRLDDALELCFENVENCRKRENPWNLAFTYINIGNIYLAKDIMEKATESFREAAKLSTEIQAYPLFIDAMLGISLVWKKQGITDKSIKFLQFISKCPIGDIQTRLEAQQLLVEFVQDGYFVNTGLAYEDWQIELDRFGQELEILSNQNS